MRGCKVAATAVAAAAVALLGEGCVHLNMKNYIRYLSWQVITVNPYISVNNAIYLLLLAHFFFSIS